MRTALLAYRAAYVTLILVTLVDRLLVNAVSFTDTVVAHGLSKPSTRESALN